MSNISLEEAKSLMTEGSLEHLKDTVIPKPVINTSIKINNDIIMSALCTAVNDGVIKTSSLDDRLVKLLNSPTNTLSAAKLDDILIHLNKHQPGMSCVITLKKGGIDGKILGRWSYNGNGVSFNPILDFVLKEFDITPTMIRVEMVNMLKVTIVNNVAQFVAKYELCDDEAKKDMNVSISTITRLVNMVHHILYAEFAVI